MSTQRLHMWKEQIFGNPVQPTHGQPAVHFAMSSTTFNVLEHRGALGRVSPEELSHAVVIALAEAVSRNADDAEIGEWLKVVLSYPCVFEVVGGEDNANYWRAFALRQGKAGEHDLTKRTARQWCIEARWSLLRRDCRPLVCNSCLRPHSLHPWSLCCHPPTPPPRHTTLSPHSVRCLATRRRRRR